MDINKIYATYSFVVFCLWFLPPLLKEAKITPPMWFKYMVVLLIMFWPISTIIWIWVK